MSHLPKTSQKLKSLFWIVVVLGILVLSWVGLGEMYPETNSLRYMPDRVFRLIKIATGNDPISPVEPPNVPLSLIIVKILVSLMLLRALFKLVQCVFFEQYTQLKASIKRHHLIVIGIGNKGSRIIEDYRHDTGMTAVAIEKNADHRNLDTLRRLGHAVVIGDATEPNALKNANARHAHTLICFIKNEQNAIQIASQLTQLQLNIRLSNRPLSPIRCFVHLDNPRLVNIFHQHSDCGSQPHPSGNPLAPCVNIRFFNLYSMIARRFFYQLPQDIAPVLQQPNTHVRFLLWGFDDVSQVLLLQGLRTFHLLPSQSSEWLIFTANARVAEQRFLDKYPQAVQLSEQTGMRRIQFIDDTEQYVQLIDEHIHRATLHNDAPTNLYQIAICASGKDKRNLATAVELLHQTSDGYPPHDFLIYVLYSESHDITTLLTGNARERLRFFGDNDDFCRYELITAEKQDTLAKAIHEDYLRQVAQASPMPQPIASESQYYQAQWDNLNEDGKDANRMQADHIIYKLILTNKLTSLTEGQPLTFSDSEVEQLAITEHQRWATHRYLRGWQQGDSRDDARKLHPSLVPWQALNDSEQQKDRDTILRIPLLIRERHDIEL